MVASREANAAFETEKSPVCCTSDILQLQRSMTERLGLLWELRMLSTVAHTQDVPSQLCKYLTLCVSGIRKDLGNSFKYDTQFIFSS